MSRTRGMRKLLAIAAVMAFAVGMAGAEEYSPNVLALTGGTYPPPGGESLLNSRTGEMFADTMLTSVTVQRQFAHALPSIADYNQTAHVQNSDSGGYNMSYCTPNSKWVMWDTPWYMKDTKKRDEGYLGYQTYSAGFATGISRLIGDSSAIGLAVGYDDRKMTGRDGYHWRDKADAFHAALYGGTAIGCFFVDAYAGYSRDWQRSERFVDWGGGDYDTNKARFNDTVLSAGIKASYVWILPNEMRITPAIGLDYSYARQGAINEYGWQREDQLTSSWTLLNADKARYHSLVMPITVSVNRTFTSNFLTFGGKCSLWTPEIRAGWIPQFGSKRASVNYTLPPSLSYPSSYTASSTKLGDSFGTVGAGLKIKLRDKYIFAVDYDYTFSGKYQNHSITGTYGVSF